MSTISVGINENVVISKVEITDPVKGVLAFTFRAAESGEKALPVDAFTALGGDGYAETGNGSGLTIRLFPPLAPFDQSSDGKPISAADQQKAAGDSIGEKKNLLFQILTCFMTSDKAKLDMYRGTGLTGENFPTRIVQEATLQQLFKNLAEDFVRLITPSLDNDATPVRLLLVCQSKTKNFADFRQKFVRDNPIIEPMQIPVASSKLKFTKHEITNGLNDAAPKGVSAADVAAEASETLSAEAVFNQA